MPTLSRILPAGGRSAVPIRMIREGEDFAARLDARQKAWAEANGFAGKAGGILVIPSKDGKPQLVLAGMGRDDAPSLAHGGLARKLPKGLYALEDNPDNPDADLFALGWLLSAYDFARYREEKPEPARLVCPKGARRDDVLNQAGAIWMARDLINTPVEDLGPAELAGQAAELAKSSGGRIKVVMGEELARQYPLVHAVGRGASDARQPRMIDLTWGDEDKPKLTLVGKGVCFDTGGLDLKPASGMILMKKDMGGAAAVLALARMVMTAALPVRLRVLVPAVENSVSGRSYRPSDIIRSRKGLSVEVGNTDAEGRLVLADALAAADEEAPDLLIDMATLTGAARVALGAEIAALFTRHDDLAAALARHAAKSDDPLWRLPLWEPYMAELDSPVADTGNIGNSGFGGAIIAALFLSRFVNPGTRWAHADQSGWNFRDRPGRPKGGEALAVRAIFAHLKETFA